jgi:serine/threonine-protein kinase
LKYDASSVSLGVDTKLIEPVPPLIGRYEIGGRIASGGMAHVYVGRKIGTRGRPVAVKQPIADMIDDEGLAMFLDEARIAFHVRSVHALEIVDFGQDERGTPYYVMPLVVGTSLSRLMTTMPVPVAVEVLTEAAMGLHDAHIAKDERGNELSIVHRDVSPHNILLDVDGRVRIADFGIARASERRSRTRTGQVKGKIGYLSPEQATSRPVDRRSDVFSLGIVAWELLLGERLFRAKNLVEQHQRLLGMPIPHPSKINPQVSRDVGDVVMAALERDLDKRLPDAATFAERLAAVRPRRVSADEIGEIVRLHAKEEVDRLTEIVDRVTAHGETLHTLMLPSAVLADASGATRVTGDDDAPDTMVTPPRPQPVAKPRFGFGWLSRLLGVGKR